MSDKEFSEQQDTTQPSEVITSAPALAPVAPDQRINALDILRGFALIGILLMNIEWFGRPITELGSFNPELTGLDHAIGWLIRCFVEGKFYKLFALLFGMGFGVMLTQAIRKDRPFGAWFSRRMLVLYALGLGHMFFVWQGDILHDYALAGLLLLGLIYLLRKKRFQKFNNPSSILKLALWWLTLPMLLASLVGLGFGVFVDRESLSEQWREGQEIRALVSQLEIDALESKESLLSEQSDLTQETLAALTDEEASTELATEEPDNVAKEVAGDHETVEITESEEEIELTPQEQAQEIFDAEQEYAQKGADEIAAMVDGSYWQLTMYRIKTSIKWLAFSPIFALTLLVPIFLLGYWLVISGAIKEHSKHAKLFGYMARIGLGVGIFITVGGLLIMGHPAVEHIGSLQSVAFVLFTGGQFFMAAGYLGVLVRLLDSPRCYKILAKLAPMGRMALTNYIMHSIILTSIFYGYAGGLYGEISRAPQMLIVLAIVIVQILLSSWWLQRYQFGPLEWLWRSLTYKARQPFKVVPS